MKQFATLCLTLVVSFAIHAQESQEGKVQAADFRLIQFDYQVYELGIYVPYVQVSYLYGPTSPHGHRDFDFFTLENYLFAPWMANAEQKYWDGAVWENDTKFFNTFDMEDRRERLDIQSWTGTEYESSDRIVYTFLDGEKIETETFLDYEGGGVWENSFRKVNTYDGDRLANVTEQDWATPEMVWLNDDLYVYTYNADGTVNYLTISNWDGDSWDDSYRLVYSYNADGSIDQILEQDYDSGWEDELLHTNTYDGSGFCTSRLVEEWDGTVWENLARFDFEEFAMGYPENSEVFSWDGSVWEPEYKVEFQYEEYDNGLTSIEPDLAAEWEVYPVPADDYLVVDLQGSGYTFIELTDLQGRILYRQAIDLANGGPTQLSLKELDLSSDVYLLKAGNAEVYSTRQVMVN